MKTIGILAVCSIAALFVCCTHADDNEISNLPVDIDCRDPHVCVWDPNPRTYCLQSGQPVYGQCGLQKAICVDEEKYDPTDACLDNE